MHEINSVYIPIHEKVNQFSGAIKTGQNVYDKIEKTGQNIMNYIEKRGKRGIVKKGGENLCIEKTPLS